MSIGIQIQEFSISSSDNRHISCRYIVIRSQNHKLQKDIRNRIAENFTTKSLSLSFGSSLTKYTINEIRDGPTETIMFWILWLWSIFNFRTNRIDIRRFDDDFKSRKSLLKITEERKNQERKIMNSNFISNYYVRRLMIQYEIYRSSKDDTKTNSIVIRRSHDATNFFFPFSRHRLNMMSYGITSISSSINHWREICNSWHRIKVK